MCNESGLSVSNSVEVGRMPGFWASDWGYRIGCWDSVETSGSAGAELGTKDHMLAIATICYGNCVRSIPLCQKSIRPCQDRRSASNTRLIRNNTLIKINKDFYKYVDSNVYRDKKIKREINNI